MIGGAYPIVVQWEDIPVLCAAIDEYLTQHKFSVETVHALARARVSAQRLKEKLDK